MSLSTFGPEAIAYDDGSPARNVALLIVARGTNTPAALFADIGGAVPKANPISTDEYGNLSFCAATGDYDLLFGTARIPFSLAASGGAGGSSYVHTQTILNDTWTIIHSLGFKPQVSVVIGGNEIIADVDWPDNNTVIVRLDVPRMGTAYLS